MCGADADIKETSLWIFSWQKIVPEDVHVVDYDTMNYIIARSATQQTVWQRGSSVHLTIHKKQEEWREGVSFPEAGGQGAIMRLEVAALKFVLWDNKLPLRCEVFTKVRVGSQAKGHSCENLDDRHPCWAEVVRRTRTERCATLEKKRNWPKVRNFPRDIISLTDGLNNCQIKQIFFLGIHCTELPVVSAGTSIAVSSQTMMHWWLSIRPSSTLSWTTLQEAVVINKKSYCA